jgi:HK97 family phage major capsid protein
MPDQTLLEQLTERRSTLLNEMATAIEARQTARTEFEARTDATDEHRSTFAAAETAFGAEHEARKAELVKLDQRIDEAELVERRRADAASASRNDARVNSEPLTYRADNAAKVSYFRDLAVAEVSAVRSQSDDPQAALDRLQRHANEMNVEIPRREAEREARAMRQADEAEREFRGSFLQGVRRGGLEESPFEKRVNPNRTDGQGGYFVPPVWLIDQYIKALRAGRVAADMCRQMDLPAGTDSINIPKIATATATGIQAADGGAVPSTDFTDTVVTAPVRTIAGQQDVALQLVEQSPGTIVDQAILEDLTADYNMQVDRQVLLGTGANGQITGLLPIANWSGNTVTWTSASPVGQSFNAALNASASKASYNRYDLSALASVVHPRRGFWYGSTLDGTSGTSGRPLVNPRDTGYNVVAIAESRLPAEGRIAGTSLGYGVYIDGNMPIIATAAGAVTGGTNDLALTAHWDDLWLFEGQLRTRVLGEVLSGTLQIRFQVYNYVAFLARYGQSISVVQGTGLASPTYAGDTSITF